MDEKIKELAQKHNIPETLLREAIEMERDKVTLQNRRIVPKLVNLIEDYLEHHPEYNASIEKKDES